MCASMVVIDKSALGWIPCGTPVYLLCSGNIIQELACVLKLHCGANDYDMCGQVIAMPCDLEQLQSVNLVDPASSHMLVSKVKPCMCVYNFLHDATANGSIIQLLIAYIWNSTWIPSVILKLTHG